MTNEKQGAAEWLRGIVGESYRKDSYPSCTGITETFFGVKCQEMHTCGSCILAMFTAIADRIDAERALPEGIEWPRFEDGELVKIGDEIEFDSEAAKVLNVAFSADRFYLFADTATASGQVYGDLGERVNRPALKVLGADGEPIEVGDTVYCDGEDEALTVTSISGVDSDYCCVTVKNADSSHCTVDAPRLSHERPDSWERIEEDAAKRVCEYAGAKKSVVDADRYTCLECPYDEPGPHTDAGCNERMRLDLVRRAKALAKAGE